MGKLISVIVPIYRSEKYLDKCISSIVGQTYQNLEIILVDDGSPDKCPDMCDRWAEEDCRIKVIHKVNGGPSSARNSGIESASGDYLSFVDSDDWIALDLFERVMKIFDENDPDIVTFDCNRINEKGEIYASTENIEAGLISSEKAIHELLKGNINNYAVNKVYKKHVFEGVRFPEGRTWEDMAIAYKLLLNCTSVYCYPAKLYFYYTRSDSISKMIDEKALGHIFLARYECHVALKEVIPSAQRLSLPLAVLSARRLYDRSLWSSVDADILALAKRFLAENRDTILNEIKDKKYWLFFKLPKLYSVVRILRHKIGIIVKRLL